MACIYCLRLGAGTGRRKHTYCLCSTRNIGRNDTETVVFEDMVIKEGVGGNSEESRRLGTTMSIENFLACTYALLLSYNRHFRVVVHVMLAVLTGARHRYWNSSRCVGEAIYQQVLSKLSTPLEARPGTYQWHTAKTKKNCYYRFPEHVTIRSGFVES